MASESGKDAGTHPERKQASATPVIVGIGASAGGIQALQTFFEAIPNDTGAAFVVVVHLDPQSHSELSSILGARTRMPVVQVDGTEKLQANRVYVIAPARRLHISAQAISSAKFDEPRGHRAPIDHFFRSLAEKNGDGFAVILTGAGSDGTTGVRAVKEAGGIILVQDPNEADYPSMPRSAIATGVADFVLPVRELAVRLAELMRNKDIVSIVETGDFDEDLVRRILAHLRVRTGHDFAKYKRSTVLRRIARRMQVTRADNLDHYYEFLRDHADEAQALLGDLFISVTTFFRDSEAFNVLKVQVIPHLFESKDPTGSIRVWVAGCATGEEVYSIAIMLLEEAGRHDIHPPIQVFGSDLDARALVIAREGRYPAAIEADVSEERLRRFFLSEGDHYRVRRELRDIVVFAVHDLLKDPPFSRIDLISCRNVLIYLDRELQPQICNTFHYALNSNGFLFLGSAETADNPAGLFRTFDRQARIYQSTAQLEEKPRLLPRLLGDVGITDQRAHLSRVPLSPRTVLSEAALHRQALEMVAPPNVLVDRTHRVLHLSEHAGRYLQPPGGPPTGDLVELVRPELRLELRSALHRVFEHRQATLTLPILVQFNGAPHRVHLQVKPVGEDSEAARNAVVMFIEGEALAQPPASPDLSAESDETVRRLREELQLTHAHLRTTLEESESATEELRAANEELQSVNEEYRSTSEELETSKEELQSINEELQTVNSELKQKLEAVSRAHSDLQNLMAATDFGILFLDSILRIKLFTEPVTELFRITSSDEGRPITDFAHQLEYRELVKDAQTVLSRLAPINREIYSQNDRWFDIRLRPYRTVDDKIDGVIITFVDITERRLVEEALRERERQLRQQKILVELSRDPILMWDFDGGILEWNRGCEELYGFTREEAIGRRKEQLLNSSGAGFTFTDVRAKLLDEGSWSGELMQRTKDGGQLTVESRIQLEKVDGHRLVLESVRDITQRKALEKRQGLLLAELSHRVKNTLAVIQAIAHQTMRGTRTPEEFTERFDGRLLALSAAHNLLVESNWEGAGLAALARIQLQAFIPDRPDRLLISGEPVLLPAELATPFGLVLHELAANAAKYGSLTGPNGTVTLSWICTQRNHRRLLRVSWQEKGGPRALPPAATSGFGSTLIQIAIPDATVNREFGDDGLVCTIDVVMPGDRGNGAERQT
jgi:two-component system, chemotaxis family, CheB/CheR fusion protein